MEYGNLCLPHNWAFLGSGNPEKVRVRIFVPFISCNNGLDHNIMFGGDRFICKETAE